MNITAICNVDLNHHGLLRGWCRHIRRFTDCTPHAVLWDEVSATATIDGILAQSGPIVACDADVWFVSDVRQKLQSWDWSRIGMVQDGGIWNPDGWVRDHADRTHAGQPYWNLGMIVADLSRPEVRSVFESARAEVAAFSKEQAVFGNAWRYSQTAVSLAVNQSLLVKDLGWGWNYWPKSVQKCPWKQPEAIYAVHAAGAHRTVERKLKRLLELEAQFGTPHLGSRADLPAYFTRRGYKFGVEIGVSQGRFAETILSGWDGTLHGVDPYLTQPLSIYNDGGMGHPDFTALKRAGQKRLAKFGKRHVLHEMYSTQAARQFPDRSLDFVYIDGNHSYEACAADIEAWLSKIRPGGTLAGHDYSPQLSPVPYPGVIRAVDELIASTGWQLNLTNDKNRVQSFWINLPA